MKFLTTPTRNLFFTGKGGVGKTSMACATAVQLADRGLRVLLVSTDPASNLDEVLGSVLHNVPTSIESVPNLYAMNLDPEAAADDYRERIVGPYRGVLPDAALRSMEEQFSGACTLEIAAFDEFSKLLGDKQATSKFDHVIFDTAPTGHTLRLLTLPSAWTGFIENNTTGTSCLGPLAGLKSQTLIYQQTVDVLADARLTTLILVTRPEPSAFREAARTSVELQNLGVHNQHLIVNGVFTCRSSNDAVATALQLRGDEAIAGMPDTIRDFERTTVPMSWNGLMGVDSLRQVGNPTAVQANDPADIPAIELYPEGIIEDSLSLRESRPLRAGEGQSGLLKSNVCSSNKKPSPAATASDSPGGRVKKRIVSNDLKTARSPRGRVKKNRISSGDNLRRCCPEGLGSLIDELASVGKGVILAMGKGGVGKTTVAAAVAVALAERGFDVQLSTTDPAAHVAATIAADEITGLSVGRIDPAAETADYTAEVLQTAGGVLDAQGKALLKEDLRSPCTEEIAVFRAFARAVSEGTSSFVVLDTAPTGHTILLLDSALAYHREVTRQTSQMPESVENLLPRLRDPEFTRVLIVTLPEATPVHEAARLQQDLRRAEIEPFAWVINQSLVPLDVSDPTLRRRQHHELPFIEEVTTTLAKRVALVPWQSEPPTGLAGLRRIVTSES